MLKCSVSRSLLAWCVTVGVLGAQPSSPFHQEGAPWFEDVSAAAVDAQSSEVIAWLEAQGGWGFGRMQIDFSIVVLTAEAATPMRTFEPNSDFYDGECDRAPVPVPLVGNIEGEKGYECTGDGDCHLIVLHQPSRTLYEMWRANIVGSTFYGGCMAIWDLDAPYVPEGRGEECTSADAAGLPIAPLLFTADEVAAGTIDHAIRFILPNARIRHCTYVRPATHATCAASGGASAPPYGTRLRLRADYPLATLPNEGARTVARAMQKYGIILADGGNVALTAQSDTTSTASWDGLLGSRDLDDIKVTDFAMVEAGTRFTWSGDCTLRNPVVQRGRARGDRGGRPGFDGGASLRLGPDGNQAAELFDLRGTRLGAASCGRSSAGGAVARGVRIVRVTTPDDQSDRRMPPLP